jgi:hypothetical protein
VPARAPAQISDLLPEFEPETDLERAVAEDSVLLGGLAWGEPRSGHPEGAVAAHVADLLRTVDEWGETGERRDDLRFIALVHDALKYRVRHWLPRTGGNHHATRARRFAEGYTDDERLLSTIELHDRPYAVWRKLRRQSVLDDPDAGEGKVSEMLDRLADPSLFLRFVELDGSTEGKNPEPIRWFREQLRRRGVA